MKRIVLLLAIALSGINAQNKNELTTVNNVDLKRYTGLWYEIAKIPNSFQEDCAENTTAEYRINEEGVIEVKNSCIEKDGSENVAEGVARVVDKKTNAKLEVSFFSIFGLNLFWGDYWIIGLDKDYRYAIIGHPERKYGWILSRTPKMSQQDLEEAYKILTSKGYDKNRFQMSEQN